MKKKAIALCSTVLLTNLLCAGGLVKEVQKVETPIAPVVVKTPYYVGVGLGVHSASTYRFGTDTFAGGTLKAGYEVLPYLALELRASQGLVDGDELSQDYAYSAYLVPKYQWNSKTTVYGLLGVTKAKLTFNNEAEINGIMNNETIQTGFSYGAGIDYKVTKNWSLFLDALSVIDEDTTDSTGSYAIEISTITVGATYHF
jgi:opacity protein-like surface antigen